MFEGKFDEYMKIQKRMYCTFSNSCNIIEIINTLLFQDGYQPFCCFSGKTYRHGCECCDRCVKKTGDKCGGFFDNNPGRCENEDLCVLVEKRDRKLFKSFIMCMRQYLK